MSLVYLSIWQKQYLWWLFGVILESQDLVWQAKENHRKPNDQSKKDFLGVSTKNQEKHMSGAPNLQ